MRVPCSESYADTEMTKELQRVFASAKKRNPDALFCMGVYYSNAGELEQAFNCWKQAAAKGDANAQYRLGNCYQTNWGVEQSDSMAYYWLLKA